MPCPIHQHRYQSSSGKMKRKGKRAKERPCGCAPFCSITYISVAALEGGEKDESSDMRRGSSPWWRMDAPTPETFDDRVCVFRCCTFRCKLASSLLPVPSQALFCTGSRGQGRRFSRRLWPIRRARLSFASWAPSSSKSEGFVFRVISYEMVYEPSSTRTQAVFFFPPRNCTAVIDSKQVLLMLCLHV